MTTLKKLTNATAIPRKSPAVASQGLVPHFRSSHHPTRPPASTVTAKTTPRFKYGAALRIASAKESRPGFSGTSLPAADLSSRRAQGHQRLPGELQELLGKQSDD